MKEEVEHTCKHPSVITLPDPIDMDHFYLQDRQYSREKFFGSTDNAPWVLFTTLSRTNPVKRVDLALEAIRIAQQDIKNLTIKIANGIPHEQMPLFVSACDVALCTSTHEGWPNSIKEALACGIPFVSTDVSDLHDIARKHPICKIIPPQAESIAQEINSVVSNGCSRYQELREEISAMNTDFTTKHLLATYENLLAKI